MTIYYRRKHWITQTTKNKVSSIMTSSNGNIFRVTGPCAGNSLVVGELPSQRPVTRSFEVFYDLLLNSKKRMSKQSVRLWFRTPSRSWRHFNVCIILGSPWTACTYSVWRILWNHFMTSGLVFIADSPSTSGLSFSRLVYPLRHRELVISYGVIARCKYWSGRWLGTER